MAAVSTILLRRSSACVISGGQFYCRYLSTAANRSRLFVPTAISSVRQFSSSPVVNNTQTPSPDVERISQQAINNDQLVRDVLAQLGSLRGEIESLRKANKEERKEEEAPREEEKQEVVFVKEKHPLLKAIESEISKTENTSQADKLPDGFEVECDKPGVAKVILKKSYKKENISIELFNPSDFFEMEMKLIVKVSFPRIFTSTVAEFHCIASHGDLMIERIKDPSDGPHNGGVIFNQLPDTLQKEFYDYLEVRGVSEHTSGLLCDYLQDKMKRENMRGLGKFKKFVEDA